MSAEKKTAVTRCVVAAGAAGCLYCGVLLAEYVPFPGKLPVALVSVNTANEIVVSFETWPGFRRNATVVLPGIAVPADTPRADACEREKAARALEFTRQFVGEATQLYMQDMRMETSADESGISDIISEKGSLSQALKAEGLARSDSVPADTSWCK